MANENSSSPKLILSSAPHIKSDQSLKKIMLFVVLALVPANIFAVYTYGMNALLLIIVSVISAVIAEACVQLLMKRPVTVTDGSAVITGLLLAMNLPPEAPVWMAAIGSFFAIIIVKQLFGGIGFNIFNPALAARAFLMASWPVHMTTAWTNFNPADTGQVLPKNILSNGIALAPGMPNACLDAVTQATPLALLKEVPGMLADSGCSMNDIYSIIFSKEIFKSLLIGDRGGCIGETSVILLLIGAIFLLYKKIISWHIPVSFIGIVSVFMFIYYYATDFSYPVTAVFYQILSGGLMLGAFFMATDMVTSPVTPRGMIIFGAGCGLITSIIRIWGGYPEGVSYSILLMNALVPLIDRYVKPKVFGAVKADKVAAQNK